ncbi:MAG: glycosyltransferase [Bacteroidia bacterium]
MKFSIITACYNAETYLEDTIRSILQQHGNFEIEYTILDNCSTDRTGEIIQRYLKLQEAGQLKYDCRSLEIHYLCEPDSGLYDALVKGFEMATGEIIAYINANDFYFPGAFATVHEIFEENREVQWLTGIPVSTNETGQPVYWVLPLRYNISMIRQGYYGRRLYYVQQESTFWKKELLKAANFETLRKMKLAGDYYLWFSFAAVAKLYQVRSFLAASRQHADRLSADRAGYEAEIRAFSNKKGVKNHLRAFAQYGLTYLLPDKIKTILNPRIFFYSNNKWKKGK